MHTTSARIELCKIKQDWGSDSVAFVPTMGALHEGHLSLVKLAQERADNVIVSIFVNPTQFAPHEDFDAYPRDVGGDLKLLEALGVTCVYTPSAEEIYPGGVKSDVQPGPAAEGLEGDFRPHFFGGVCSVVKTLFDHVQPDIAVFGEKDYQQLMVIKEMVNSLKLPIEITGAPIVRDEYGLALSSRNAYLSPGELQIARQLNIILHDANSGKEAEVTEKLLTAGFDKVDYVEKRWSRILAAVHIGGTRLIDNVKI